MQRDAVPGEGHTAFEDAVPWGFLHKVGHSGYLHGRIQQGGMDPVAAGLDMLVLRQGDLGEQVVPTPPQLAHALEDRAVVVAVVG
jgi:hypothetical protein